MKSVVITGSTRGIGYGLAEQFLERGCQVVVNGRSTTSVDEKVIILSKQYSPDRITGQAGDVTNPADHQTLWDTAVATFGKVDIWINNAGISHPLQMVWEIPAELVNRVVDIDLKGVIFGSQIAIRGMQQQGFGHLYNMEGFGSNGKTRPGLSIYGTTKAGLSFLSKALTEETKESTIKVSTISPGMVVTEFITGQYKDDPQGLEAAKRIFNILGDSVETVTPWLVDKMLANEKSGAHINWLTPRKVTWRFMTARFNKRDLFTE